jgi:hypothetical protein
LSRASPFFVLRGDAWMARDKPGHDVAEALMLVLASKQVVVRPRRSNGPI